MAIVDQGQASISAKEFASKFQTKREIYSKLWKLILFFTFLILDILLFLQTSSQLGAGCTYLLPIM